MKDSLRFVHCSDVHLGANPYQIKERFDDMGKVFKDVVDYALNIEDLDFFVIGGDLFHKKNLNAETLDQCIEILKPLNDKNIPIYVTEGNHDKSNIIHNYS
ncbi:MAG: metallophosphoesterase [Clostridia bacterium]|nr:metallophosphoesterase [Clostridia bacterium]